MKNDIGLDSDLFVPIQILIAQACWNVDCWQPKLILIAGIWSDTGCLLLLLGAGIIIQTIYQKYVKIIHFCTKRFSAIYLGICTDVWMNIMINIILYIWNLVYILSEEEGGALASKVVFEIHFKQFWGGQTGCYIFLKASL